MIIILFNSGMYIWPSVWSDYAQHTTAPNTTIYFAPINEVHPANEYL